MTGLPRRQVLLGDATQQLKRLPPASVDCVITSPPYYMLRNYGAEGQLGLEPHVDQWVDELLLVCRGLAKALKPTASLWLNLGDSFSRHAKFGAPPKSLLAAPERLLLALIGDGWICRAKVVWAKPNPMPSSVTDRLNMTYEIVYHLVRSGRYYFDLDAIREPHRSQGNRTARLPIGKPPAWAGPLAGSQDGLRRARPDGLPGHALGKNPGDVWTIPTRGFHGAHFATFPEALVVRPLLATCPEAICTQCGEPWRRTITSERLSVKSSARNQPKDPSPLRRKAVSNTLRTIGDPIPCGCQVPTAPGVVLDPFFGSGTVGVVAEKYGRDWIGVELNPDYAELANERLERERVKRHREMGNERRSAA